MNKAGDRSDRDRVDCVIQGRGWQSGGYRFIGGAHDLSQRGYSGADQDRE